MVVWCSGSIMNDISHSLHALDGEFYGSVACIMKRPINKVFLWVVTAYDMGVSKSCLGLWHALILSVFVAFTYSASLNKGLTLVLIRALNEEMRIFSILLIHCQTVMPNKTCCAVQTVPQTAQSTDCINKICPHKQFFWLFVSIVLMFFISLHLWKCMNFVSPSAA